MKPDDQKTPRQQRGCPAGDGREGGVRHRGLAKWATRRVDSRAVRVSCPPAQAFRRIERIGGETGWYYADWLWRLRGFLDLMVGGVGLHRGRRHPDRLAPGDPVDCWRVEVLEPERLLRLVAEMRLPGRAWLQFEVESDNSGTTIRQTAIFDPRGLPGLVYWYVLYPVHKLVFAGILRGIARAAGSAEQVR